MKISRLLNKLPDFNVFTYLRLAERMVPKVRPELQAILDRVMGDVVDWLRLTPNAVVA